MSSLEHRRNGRIPRERRGGIHPGWKVFLCAFGSGAMTLYAIVFAALHPGSIGWSPAALVALILFYAGGKTAENLMERPRDPQA